MYHEGKGVPQDFAEAARWYRRAADHGHAMAQYNLGTCYANAPRRSKGDRSARTHSFHTSTPCTRIFRCS
jgi:TPR repeat protein